MMEEDSTSTVRGEGEQCRKEAIEERLEAVKREQVVGLVQDQFSLLNTFHRVFSEVKDHEKTALCNQLLDLPRGARSDVCDLLLCRYRLEAAIECARGEDAEAHLLRGESNVLTEMDFYTTFLHPSVDRLWCLVCESRDTPSDYRSISKRAGLRLFGLSRHNKQLRLPYDDCPYPTYASLIKQVKGLYEYVCKNTNTNDQFLIQPTENKIKAFLSSQMESVNYKATSSPVTRAISSTTTGKSSKIRRSPRSPAKACGAQSPSDKCSKKMDTYNNKNRSAQRKVDNAEQVETLGLSSNETLYEDDAEVELLLEKYCKGTKLDPKKLIKSVSDSAASLPPEQKMVAGATCLGDIANQVAPRAEYDSSTGRVVLMQEDINMAVNSPLVSALVFAQLLQRFSDGHGDLLPLDVISGVTKKECYGVHGTGTAIDLYLQQHPKDTSQFVNVITFSNYISKDFIKRCKEEMNEAAFRERDSAHLRVTTLVPEGQTFICGPFPNEPNNPGSIPGVTFGNVHHEFIPSETRRENMKQSELDLINMTNLVHQWLHEVKLDVVQAALVPKIRAIRKWPSTLGSAGNKRRYRASETCHAKPTSSYPCQPIDLVDTLVCRFAASRAYDGHSDTRPLKPENFSKERPESAMQILTHGFICPNDGQKVKDDVEVGTIVHGIPTGSGTRMECTLFGHFSSTENGFKKISNKNRKIRLIGISHAHFQMPGTQGELFHYIQLPTRRRNSQVLKRLIFSMRKLMDTIEHRNSQYKEQNAKINVKALSDQCHRSVMFQPTDCSMIPIRDLLPHQRVGVSGEGKHRPKPILQNAKAKKKPRLLEPEKGSHENGHMKESEKIDRLKIIGAEIPHGAMITSEPVSKNLSALGITPVYMFNDDGTNGTQSIIAGPLVLNDDTNRPFLIKPGTQCSPSTIDFVYAKLSSSNSKHTKKVMNKLLNIIHIRRVGKNDGKLLDNILTVFRGIGELIPFQFRLGGGAAKLSGSKQMMSHHESSHRLAFTHVAASSQVLTSDDRLYLEALVGGQTVVQVFFNGLYVGAFFAAQSETRPEIDGSVMAEVVPNMNKKLKQLREEFSVQCNRARIPSSVDDQSRNELQGQSAPCYRVLLKPLDPNILSKWETEDAPVHQTIAFSAEDVEMSPIYCNNQEVKEKFGPGLDYESWMKVLYNHPSPFPTLKLHKLKELSHTAKSIAKESETLSGSSRFKNLLSRLDKQISETEVEETRNQNNSVKEDRVKGQKKYSPNQIMPILLYASAKTRIVAQCPDCVTQEDPSKIHPARGLVHAMIPRDDDEDADGFMNEDHDNDIPTANDILFAQSLGLGGIGMDEEDIKLHAEKEANEAKEAAKETAKEALYEAQYTKLLLERHLKIFLAKPTHPTLFHPSFDPTAAFAAIATRSFDQGLGAVNDDDHSWKMRNGPGYILEEATKDDAWKKLFKATLCAFMSPAIILQLYYRQHFGDSKNYHKASSDLKANPDLLLPSPNKQEVEKYVSTIKQYKWRSNRMMHELLKDKFVIGDKFIAFLRDFSETGMGIFHRALKCGKVLGKTTRSMVAVELQNGFGRIGADLSAFHVQHLMRTIEVCIHDPFGMVENVTCWKGSQSAGRCYSHLFPQVEGIDENNFPAKLVHWLNEEVKKGLESKEEEDREKMSRWLLVNGLEMHEQLGCLVHNCGIKKKLDESDTEHLSCLLDTLIQFTYPGRNNNKSNKPARLDRDKYFPVKFTSGPLKIPARDLEILRPLKIGHESAMEAYEWLALRNAYKLDGELLTIDVRGPDE